VVHRTPDVVNDDGRAASGQEQRELATKPATGAGDDGDPTVEAE
jgi:hypothetical protein